MTLPQRMCICCRKRNAKNELIRISKCDNKPVVDNKKVNNSRGIYICKNDKCLDLLKKNKAIERFLNVSPDEELFQNLKKMIEEKSFD